MADYSKHQQQIIKNYYKNQDAILVQRLSDLVSELYLAESDKKKKQLWKRVATALEKLEVPASQIEHLTQQKDPALLAKTVERLLAK